MLYGGNVVTANVDLWNFRTPGKLHFDNDYHQTLEFRARHISDIENKIIIEYDMFAGFIGQVPAWRKSFHQYTHLIKLVPESFSQRGGPRISVDKYNGGSVMLEGSFQAKRTGPG
jgi:hypothetical protein